MTKSVSGVGRKAVDPEAAHLRAKIAGLTIGVKIGNRTPDDPELVSAQRDLKARMLYKHIERVLAEDPPLTKTQRHKIAAILRA